KRRRTYTSWFKPGDFVDLPGFAERLRPGRDQDPVSKYLYDQLSEETRRLLSDVGDQSHLRRNLAHDLNLILDRDLQVKNKLAEKRQKKSAVEQQIAEGSNSEYLQRRNHQLDQEIADLAKISLLYDPERFKQVQISEYLQDFIKENPQSHSRVRLNRLLLEAA